MRVAVYGRVSTEKQDVDIQRERLTKFAKSRGFTIVKAFYETFTGKTTNRPKFEEMMALAEKKAIDAVVVTKLDRFARSLQDLVTTIARFDTLGIKFVCTDQEIDTTTPAGKLLLHVLGAIAEFERTLIAERTKAGIQRARDKGKKFGRPKVEVNEDRLRDLYGKGLGSKAIAGAIGVGEWVVRERIKELGLRR